MNARNKRGRSALHEAAEEGAREACALLLARGADADARDEEGSTPRALGGAPLQDLWPRSRP